MAARKPLVVNGTGRVAEMPSGDAVPTSAGGTGLTSPGASGNVLTSDGTNWTSAAPGSVGGGTSLGLVNAYIALRGPFVM